ncbi:hypothetical protein IWQ62_003637 [Dispira parvispora]|uniref:Uncharacterized protein n=1 Tax=Dispira parvispora TaxID=1520584 RepID=A0A9W8ATT3_9FUNG|nr:hypothetical protein IWQ62_003637 [Dispira parvispora]
MTFTDDLAESQRIDCQFHQLYEQRVGPRNNIDKHAVDLAFETLVSQSVDTAREPIDTRATNCTFRGTHVTFPVGESVKLAREQGDLVTKTPRKAIQSHSKAVSRLRGHLPPRRFVPSCGRLTRESSTTNKSFGTLSGNSTANQSHSSLSCAGTYDATESCRTRCLMYRPPSSRACDFDSIHFHIDVDQIWHARSHTTPFSARSSLWQQTVGVQSMASESNRVFLRRNLSLI